MRHQPVAVQSCLRYWLTKATGRLWVDGTVGMGGHSEALLRSGQLPAAAQLLCVDRDSTALAAAEERLRAVADDCGRKQDSLHFFHGSYAEALRAEQLAALQLPAACDGLLLDLGIGSHQLDDAARGFSVRHDAPLDMRFDGSEQVHTAAALLARMPEHQLRDVIRRWAEEPRAAAVARALVAERGAIATTGDLAAVIRRVLGRRGKVQPIFQALRIAVNDELSHVAQALAALPSALTVGGAAVVLSFHSLEDGAVKRRFRAAARDGSARLLTKRAEKASAEEVQHNPRARSVRLRAIERLC